MKHCYSGLLATTLISMMIMALVHWNSEREYLEDMSLSGTSYEDNGNSSVYDHFLQHPLRILNYSGLACANAEGFRGKIQTRNGTVDMLGFDPKDLIRHYEHWISRISYVRGRILLTVSEMYKGNWTFGGTSFRGIVSSSRGLLTCLLLDYYNGTYVLRCPLYALCQHVRVTVLHVDFSQYLGVTRRLDHVVLEKELCAQRHYVARNPPSNVWIRAHNGTWTWHSPKTDYPLPNSIFCELVDSFSHLFMVGSSHMQFQHAYTLRYCTRYKKTIKNKLQYVGIRYISKLSNFAPKLKRWSSYNKIKTQCNVGYETSKAANLPAKITECSQRKAGVLIQTGSWDASFSDFGPLMKTILPRLEGVLQNVTAFQSDVFRVLVMGPPPFYSNHQYAQCRSDEMIKEITSGLEKLCRHYGVNYLNVFDIVYPRFNESLGNDHYLQCPKGKPTCSGDVGEIVTHIAIKSLAT